jgi:uncharacterized repeat protein (TIGR01451 family)
MLARFLALAAVVAAVALVFALTAGRQRADADVPHAGLDFSIGVDTNANGVDDCDTKASTGSIPNKCSLATNADFTVRVYLNALGGIASYEGYDVQLNFSIITSYDVADAGPNNGNWPSCTFAGFSFGAGTQSFGCVTSGAASTYTGRLATSNFKCSSSNNFGSITMVHGQGSTDLVENIAVTHAEGIGTSESLTITCGTPPTFTATHTNTPTKTNTPTNTFTPTITSTPTNTFTPTNTPTATPLPSDQPDVTVTKTDSPDPVDPGGTISYNLLVKNLGLQTATGVFLGDALPGGTNGVAFVSANSTGAACGYDSGFHLVFCQLTNPLAHDATVKIVIQVTAPSPTEDVRISNTATVGASNEPFFNQGNNTDVEETVVLAERADLKLTKVDLSDPVDSGGNVVYDLTVENIGPQPATDVIIKDNLPPGATFVPGGSSVECTVPGGAPVADPDIGEVDVECDLGTNFVGQVTVQIEATMPAVQRDSLPKNLAFVTGGNELFSQTGNNMDAEFTAVLAPPPDVALDKAGPASVKRVQKFSYTLTVTNPGFGDAFNVNVTDTLPKHVINSIPQPMTLQSTSGASCGTPVSNQFSCTIAKLPSGGQVVITVNVRAPTVMADVLLTNQASASVPNEPGDNPGNNSDSQDTTIEECSDVDGDGLVRVSDIIAVIQHYGTSVGEPEYDLLFDFDGNGTITVADIIHVVQHYNQDCI